MGPDPTSARARRALVAVVLAALSACGGGDASEPEVATGPEADGDAEWSEQVLPTRPGADRRPLVAVDGETVVVVVTDEADSVTGFSSDGDARFEAGQALTTDVTYLNLGGVARLGGQWVALGSGGRSADELEFDLHAFSSTDGRTWSEVEASGHEGPADVLGLAATPDRVVGVGALRTANDPGSGGFGPVAWTSRDGAAWTTVPLPVTGRGEGAARAAIATNGGALAWGDVDGRGVVWSSSDGGASWTIVEPDGLPLARSWDSVASHDAIIVASGTRAPEGEEGGESGQVLARSRDGGDTWQPVAEPPPANRGEPFPFTLWAGGQRFFTLGYTFIDAFADRELCYADIELCRQDTSTTLYVSDDGDRWERVDTSGIDLDQYGDVDAATATATGRVVALTGGPTGPASGPGPPTRPCPQRRSRPTPPRRCGSWPMARCPSSVCATPPRCTFTAAWSGSSSATRRGAAPTMDPTSRQAPATGTPDDWPVAQQTIFGFVTLVVEGRIEYSIGDGEVVATYARTQEPPPRCI